MQILVIEDDAISGRIAQGVAKLQNDDMMLATTGAEGLELCKENDFDFVIIDMRLPDMDGHSVAARLRQTEKDRYTFLCALSAHILKESDVAFLLKDFNFFHPKPLTVDTLKNIKARVQRYQKTLALY